MYKNDKKINKVLLPLDGSTFSEIASIYAPDLVRNQDVELTLLRVLVSESRRSLEEELDYLDNQVKTINAAIGVQIESGALKPKIKKELVAGHPESKILSYVKNKNVDLIIMATHGRSGISKLLMGSVANKVVRSSKIPVLLFKPRKGKGKGQDTIVTRKVIIPLDGSKLGDSVVSFVQTFISQFGNEHSEIILLSVCEPSPIKSGRSVVISEAAEAATSKAFKRGVEAEQYLSKLARSVRNDGFNVTTEIVIGDPAEKINKQARKHGVDLIAMATHGRSGITRMAYGSVAEAVINRAKTPILLLRPRQ